MGWRRSSTSSSSSIFSDDDRLRDNLDRTFFSSSSLATTAPPADNLLDWPFRRIETLDRDDLRHTAYEIFFTCCRSTPGFGANRNAPSYYPADGGAGNNGMGGVGMTTASSRVKRALGLRTRRTMHMRSVSYSYAGSPMTPMHSHSGSLGGGGGLGGKVKQRPMTSAEIMRLQMGVTEQSDARLRKTLMRSLAGQVSRRAETIILPLELLRQLKPSEFSDSYEYHQWQRRQLKILEAGLLLHPSIPLDRLNSAGLRFSDIMRASEMKPIDTSKNSEVMRNLSNCVLTLAWRNNTGAPVEVCHWADGFPLNVHLYLSLLHSIFDLREETVVIDEVDELLELMRKTWTTLGISRTIHNVLLTWVLFEQYITTGQVEPDLLSATLSMLVEVANDAKTPDREPGYIRVLSATMASIQGWAEKKLLDYHEGFQKASAGTMENVICLALSTAKIIAENVSSPGRMLVQRKLGDSTIFSPTTSMEQFIKSSLKNTFTKMSGNKSDSMVVEIDEDPNESLLHLVKETEELALTEKEIYSPVLKRWHPFPAAIAVVSLHNCFRVVLKNYLTTISSLTNELVRVLQAIGKLEKTLVQMAVEELVESEDGGKAIIREMVPYEIDAIIVKYMKSWIEERLRLGRECVNRAKDTENWSLKSKSEPYAQSAVDLMKLAKVAVDEFFEIQVAAKDELVQDLADGLDSIVQDYTSFVASCGTKQSYIPNLPPLTRCNQDSTVFQFWKCKAGIDPGLCRSGMDSSICQNGPSPSIRHIQDPGSSGEMTSQQRTTASRGTQRLYIRLNTLHFILNFLNSIDKSLSAVNRSTISTSPNAPAPRHRTVAPTHFDTARSAIHAATLHVAELAAYRLIFVDCSTSFYESLYFGNVAEARINQTLRLLKSNLSLLVSMLTDRAQPLAVREVMKASFEAFLLVLLAGGSGRAFTRSDSAMIAEDFAALKRLFCTSGEGLVAEEVVEREAEVVEGIINLMSFTTEKLVEEFSIKACEASGLGRSLERVPMPPTIPIRWHRSDPTTMLRILCYRDDDVANRFLKKAFELPKRR